MHTTIRPLAALAGGLFAITAAIDIPHDQATEFAGSADYVLEACFAAALTAAAAASWMLLRAATGLAAQIGWGLAGLGSGTVAVVATATLLKGGETLDSVFPIGLLAMLLGYVVLAITDVRKRVVPRYAGLTLALSSVAMIMLGDGYGVIAWSAGWFAVAALASAPLGVSRGAAQRAATT